VRQAAIVAILIAGAAAYTLYEKPIEARLRRSRVSGSTR
jgi:peptidoglycan/LPS O-acetylase OafA/YrhL